MNATRTNWRKVIVMIKEDLRLFGSLCIAELIVWRALRNERKHPSFDARMKVVQGGGLDWRKG